MARVDLYQQVADRVVAELEKGVAPWVRPWRTLSETGGLPHNGYTKRSYRGVNVWVLAMSAASRGRQRFSMAATWPSTCRLPTASRCRIWPPS